MLDNCCFGTFCNFCNKGANIIVIAIVVMVVLAILFFIARKLGLARKKKHSEENTIVIQAPAPPPAQNPTLTDKQKEAMRRMMSFDRKEDENKQ